MFAGKFVLPMAGVNIRTDMNTVWLLSLAEFRVWGQLVSAK